MQRTLRTDRLGKRQAGFSTAELALVVTIILIIAGIVVPNLMQAWYNIQLRTATSAVSDLMQQARIQAAKNNATYPVRFQVNNGVQQVFIDLNNNGSLDPGETYIDLERHIAAAAGAPNGNGQPNAYVLSGNTTSGTPFDNTNTLAFSPRGLPCNYVSGTPATCTTPAASYFVYYFQGRGHKGWSAVLVTKAGRTKTLLWDGSSWR